MLESSRVYLRPLEEQDLPLRVKWVNDPEIRPMLMFDYPLSLAKTRAWFQKTLMDDTKVNFSIVEKETGAVIGMTGLIEISITHRRAQLYITIGEKKYWGRRLADEIIQLVLEYGFVELNLNKIYLFTLPANERGRKVYARNGFVTEGVLRQHYYCVGAYQDLTQQSVLRGEWAARRAAEAK
ncbi:MAG TPA: GNAT family protein [Armatimonadota bacterium]|nr:GNAT family protein [Armatimonadota bacterium]HOS42325.1 GNAT family protein [Armatimonadota bacterium]